MASPLLSDEERRAAFENGPFHLSRKQLWLAAGIAVILAVVGGLLGVIDPDGGGPAKAKPTPAASSNLAPSLGLASFLELSPVANKPAPTFALTDQNGQRVSIQSFRGKVVILSFLDDRCGALCPVVDEELLDASRDLSADGKETVFLAVNVDAAAGTVSDIRAYSSAHGLTAIPSWRFLTGDSAELSTIWQAYSVTVEPGAQGAPLTYSPAIYFIGPTGNEAYKATPFANELANGTGALPTSSVKRYGSGIAAYALRLLSSKGR
ncbi:MAG: SCO family protein [Candidatus Dormiibacterota bacterium]